MTRFSTCVSRVADAVAADGDSGSVGVGFFGAHFANHLGVGDFFAAVDGDVFVVYDVEGVRAFDLFLVAGRAGANALAKSAYFVGIGFAPNVAELRVVAELLVFEGDPCVLVEHSRSERGRRECG